MDAIIDLSKFDTMKNNEVRSFLDTLKSNLRSVVLLGVQTELLAPLLIPLLMRKMPKKLIEKFSSRSKLGLKGAMSHNTHARAKENKLEKDGPTFSSCVGDFGRLFLSV